MNKRQRRTSVIICVLLIVLAIMLMIATVVKEDVLQLASAFVRGGFV